MDIKHAFVLQIAKKTSYYFFCFFYEFFVYFCSYTYFFVHLLLYSWIGFVYLFGCFVCFVCFFSLFAALSIPGDAEMLTLNGGRQQAEASLRDVRLHMDWQETRIADLESQDIAQTARRYDSELQSMKQQLQQDRQRLEAQLLQEKRAREGAENQLHNTMSLSQSSKGFSPHSGSLGSPRKGRENSSPNKPRGSAGLQESVVLRAQLQQSREAAEREAAHWKAALEEEQRTSEKLRQQLNQLEESDQLVATAAANSQQQVHHLRQQLESEKTRTAMLDANLQAAAHSVRSSKTFKRRQRSRYTVQDSARMDDGHVDDHSWQHALGLTDNDTGSSAEEDEEDSHMDLELQPVMVTVGLQTDDVALTALLAGTAGKDSLMTAARQEILRLKDVNSRLLQQRSPGVCAQTSLTALV